MTQEKVLDAAIKSPGKEISEIAKELGIDRGTIQCYVTRLRRKKLIHLEFKKNHTLLFPTPEGEQYRQSGQST
ncbi:MAG: hypothetical protein PHH85_14280 [Candidatus Methanoperedens sp.]|nr:hypothetical protein [Candidatus Methanoperedens sp.]